MSLSARALIRSLAACVTVLAALHAPTSAADAPASLANALHGEYGTQPAKTGR